MSRRERNRGGSYAICAVLACLMHATDMSAQDHPIRRRLEDSGLERMTVGRVTTLFAPDDQARARQIAELSETAAGFFEK